MSRSGSALRALLVAAVCAAPLACSGDDDGGPVLGPVVIGITIGDTSGTDPRVYFEEVTAIGDMLSVDVKMSTMMTPVDYDAFTIEILFEPTHVQINQSFAIDTPFGPCGALSDGCVGGAGCGDPFCCTNARDANTSGNLLIGVTAPPGCTVTSAADQTLTRLVFLGATAGTSFLSFVDSAGTGDCEVLEFVPMNPPNSLGIPCLDGMAQIDSTR